MTVDNFLQYKSEQERVTIYNNLKQIKKVKGFFKFFIFYPLSW